MYDLEAFEILYYPSNNMIIRMNAPNIHGMIMQQ